MNTANDFAGNRCVIANIVMTLDAIPASRGNAHSQIRTASGAIRIVYDRTE